MSTLTDWAESVSHVLPVKIKPQMNESCSGFIMRIAAANGYPTPNWITDLEPRLKSPQYSDMKEITKALTRLIDLNMSETNFLEKALLLNRHVTDAYYYSQSMKMCPECVKTNGYLDYIWEVTFVSACPLHRIILIDHCPKCTSRLSWNRVDIKKCLCGHDLTMIESAEANERLIYYNTKLWSAMGRSMPASFLQDVPEELFHQYDLNGLCDLFRFLHRVGSTKFINSYYKLKSIPEIIDAFNVIHSMLSDWPLGLYRYLDSLRNPDGTYKGEGLKQAFGKFYLGLYGKKEFRFIEEAFEAYVRAHWTGVVDDKYKLVSSKLKCDYTLLGSAAKKIKIGQARLNKLMDIGIATGVRRPRPSGRRYTVMKKCEASKLARLSSQMINQKETCQILGVSKREFAILVEYKIINPLIKAGDRGFAEWWCDKRKIKNMVDKIIDMVPKTPLGGDTISFSRVCQAYLTDIHILPDLLRGIPQGRVQVAGMDLTESDGTFRLSSLLFCPEEIARFRRMRKQNPPNIFSIHEVAGMMGVKQEVAYHLVNAGFLKYNDSYGGHRGRLVTLHDIRDFEKTYIPLAEIARNQNQCPRTLLRTLTRIGIKPSIGGTADTCRQLFYKRDDLPRSIRSKSAPLPHEL